MRFVYFAVFICFAAVWLFERSDSTAISGRFDNLDIDEILRSDRLVKNYFQCLMERGPCTPEGSDLKRIIPDALKNGCKDCTESQKQKAGKAIVFLEKNKPEMYKELHEKYDPNGLYQKLIHEKFHLFDKKDDGEDKEQAKMQK